MFSPLLIFRLSYGNADAFLVCYSTIDKTSLRNIRAKVVKCIYLFIGSDYLKYLQWIKELNLEGPQVPKFLVGTMADMKNAERDKGKDIPTKRFARII